MDTPQITKEDWVDISRQLEMHHAVFYKIWTIGKPVFNEKIPTAAVQFDKHGDFIYFHFNPKFWEESTPYERLFIICHEALHVILNHGLRTKDSPDKEACNIALDIVVNHLLTRSFGFQREKIKGWEKLCWVDTVFKKKDGILRTYTDGSPIKTDECFEHYINLFNRINVASGGQKDQKIPEAFLPGGFGTPQTADDHDMMGDSDFEEVIDQLDEGLSDEEKEKLESIVEKYFEEEPKDKRAGHGTGGQWHFAQTRRAPPKKKWETVIKKWSMKYLMNSNKEREQWARLHRRFQFMPSNLFLPSDMEIEEKEKDKNKIQVFFFLDTSGSCWHLKDRFFQAAESLPPQKFDVRLFCFDTVVKETSLQSKKMYGGGGTYFDIMEEFIQKDIQNRKVDYPKAVFVITDGYGNKVNPKNPENWYWFLSDWNDYCIKNYIPEKCNLYKLANFE